MSAEASDATMDPMASNSMISILLLEDHASYRQALESVMRMEQDLRVVAQASNASEAGAMAADTLPTVALVDLDLPGGSGVEAITAIRHASPRTACVVLSALTDDLEFGRAIKAGASAALHKSVNIPDLLAVVRQVAAGATVFPPEETARRLRAVDLSQERDWQLRMLRETITPRELEVLERLVEGQDNRRIARDLGIAPDTVQTHIRNLLAKLAVGSRLEAVVRALRLGLVRPPGGPSGRST